MECVREYDGTETLNQRQLNVLDFIRGAGTKGRSWVEVSNKCHQEGISSEEFDSLTLLGLVKPNGQMFFTAADFF